MATSKLFNIKITGRDVVGFALSGGLLWLTWQQSCIAEEGMHIEKNTWLWILLAMVAFMLSIVLHSWRCWLVWKDRNGTKASLGNTATSLLLGNFFNAVLPGNVGEALRAWHFSRKTGVGVWKAAAGIIAEKFVDTQIYLTVLLPVIFWWHTSWREPIFLTLYFVAFLIGIANIIYLMTLWSLKFRRLIFSAIPTIVVRNRLYRTYSHLLMHLHFLYREKRLAPYVFVGYVLLCLNMLQYFAVLKAAGVEDKLHQPAIVFLIAVVMVIINVTPSAPGSIGLVHFGVFATLTLAAKILNAPQQGNVFAASGIYLHLSYFIPESIVGAWVVWRERNLIMNWNRPHLKSN
jgi:uncharacterized protein (TIRG00374 family)